jgi:MarR family 2-MHQ and catechol resistance regulon transcriptional repressor
LNGKLSARSKKEMDKLRSVGLEVGKGRYPEEIVYSSALLYSVIYDEISDYLKDFDLTVGKFNMLMVIKHQGGAQGMSQVDVSKHLIVTASNMTKMIDKLEQEGLVVRFGLEGDRRVNMVKATAKASRLLDDVWAGYIAKVKKLTSPLSQDQQKELSLLLQQWLEKVR